MAPLRGADGALSHACRPSGKTSASSWRRYLNRRLFQWSLKVSFAISRRPLRQTTRAQMMGHWSRGRFHIDLLGTTTTVAKRGRARRGHQAMTVFFLARLTHHHIYDHFRLLQPRTTLQLGSAPFAIHECIRPRSLVRCEVVRLVLRAIICRWHSQSFLFQRSCNHYSGSSLDQIARSAYTHYKTSLLYFSTPHVRQSDRHGGLSGIYTSALMASIPTDDNLVGNGPSAVPP
jgi:hypothetical protein